SPLANRNVENAVDVDYMPHVKVGYRAIVLLSQCIKDERLSKYAAGLDARRIIDGLRERVVKVPCQTFETLTYAQRRRMIIGARDSAIRRQRTILPVVKQSPAGVCVK